MDASDQTDLIAALRKSDPDRLYSALFASGDARERLVGLYSFNLEVAATRERVSEPMLGQIRLQWWRDALTEIREGRPRRHPVVEALAGWLGDAGDDGFRLAGELVDAREADLQDAPFETVEQLLAYAEATSSNLIRLALLALDIPDGPAHAAAVPIGRAYALAGLLRAVPFHGAQGRVMLPAGLLARHGIMDARQSIGRRDPEKLKSALAELAELAGNDLRSTREITGIPSAARPAMMLSGLTRLYLKRLRKAGFDLADPRLDPGPLARLFTIFVSRHFS